MARRRSSVRMQARPKSKTSGMVVGGLLLGAFVAVIILMLSIKRRQTLRAFRQKKAQGDFVERSVELTKQLAAFAREKLMAMEEPHKLSDEDWKGFRDCKDEGLVDAMILVREKLQTIYLDGAFSRGTAPELKEGQAGKALSDAVSMVKGEVTIGGETKHVTVFRKSVKGKDGDYIGAVVLLMVPPGE